MSLLAAFNRQRNGVKCRHCSQLIAADAIRRHIDSCKATVADDEECVVLSEHEEADNNVCASKPCSSRGRKRPLQSDVNTSLVGQLDESLPVKSTLADTYHLRLFNQIVDAGYNRASSFDIWSEEDKAIWQTWKGEQFDDTTRHIFIRLFLRMSGKWHALESLAQQFEKINVKAVLEQLTKQRFLVASTGAHGLRTLNDVLPLLNLAQLRQLAKIYHLKSVTNKVATKYELLDALRKHCRQKNVFGQSVETSVVNKSVQVLGTCYRLSTSVERLFVCLFNLFSPADMNTSQLADTPTLNLKSQLMNIMRGADKGECKYAMWDRLDMRAALPLFTNNQQWNDYIDAQATEREMAVCQAKQKWSMIWSMADTIRAKLTAHQTHILSVIEAKPYHLRQFTAEHVWTRCCWHAVEAAQRMKLYTQAVEMLQFLLSWPGGRCLCVDYVGRWFERLVLNQHMHLKQPDQAFWSINRAFAHEGVHAQSRLALYDRYEKLLIKMDKQPDNDALCQALATYKPPDTPEIYEFTAPTMGKELGDGERKNVFVDENGKIMSVETVAIEHYKKKYGFGNGVHCEGACWHALLGLVLWDTIHDIQAADQYMWVSPVQTQTLDLNHCQSYPGFTRTASFTERMSWLRAAEPQELRSAVTMAFQCNFEVNCSFVSWDSFESADDLADLAVCVGGGRLADLFDYLLADFRFRRSGFPDLTFWDAKTEQLMVVEVKGPGDRLSTKQRIWLDYFAKHQIKAQVCHVRAENAKSLTRVTSPTTEDVELVPL